MLTPLEIKGVLIPRGERMLPPVVESLVAAAGEGRDLLPLVVTIIQGFGFDSFVYGLSMSPRPDKEAQLYVFTTLPLEWMQIYDQKAYVEIDPRIQLVYDSTAAALWDQTSERGRNARTDEFLNDASRFGVCSGMAFTLHDVNNRGIMIAYNSKQPTIDSFRRLMIQRNLGDLLSFGHFFHEFFMRHVIEMGLPSRIRGAPMSPREREVLTLVARGLLTEDVAQRVGISPRTVQFHLDSVRTKLGAANRQEAIAIATRAGYIVINP